jgi:ornithine carbamoyltransferase
MKLRGWMAALLIVCAATPLAMAQSSDMVATTNEQYVPRLGDIMNAIQARHMKLWFAGKSRNWELATYELRQFQAGLVEAAVLYEGIPVTNVTTMTKPIQSIADTIKAKDVGRFAKAFGELTDGCNACHRSIGRGFIVMRVPTGQPFSNQVFPPQGKR